MTDVAEDAALLPAEKEVIVRFAKDEDRMTVHAEQRSFMKWLIAHPDFELTGKRVSDGVVHAVTGTIPVGVLNLSGNPRKSDQPARALGKLPEEVR